MKYKLSESANTLRNQINKKYPKRDKKSDGWIGDTRHKKTKSDHNPDPKTGFVRAIDIDSNLGIDSNLLAEQLRKTAINDKRIKYIIHNKKITSMENKWTWKLYKGQNPHLSHIHISFNENGDNDKTQFKIDWPIKTKQIIVNKLSNKDEMIKIIDNMIIELNKLKKML